MKKLFDKIKKNNKGFTLVELIVVIAIIAIITVVVAPQYLSYVEKSKEATDKNAAGEIAHAAEVAYVDASSTASLGAVTVTVAPTGAATISGDSTGNDFKTAFEKIYAGDYKFVSTAYAKGIKVTVATTGKATIEISK